MVRSRSNCCRKYSLPRLAAARKSRPFAPGPMPVSSTGCKAPISTRFVIALTESTVAASPQVSEV